ncbi:MAG: SurA N-terminal domain-containing protein, partial [Duodenibacillus sp.]|nr:SurA N-terminal domain-containing protein [Duodenibacillus sp.]
MRSQKRWLMLITTVLVIPSFVVTGIYSYNRMMSDDGAIAKVDGESVTPQQYDEAKRRHLDNLRARLGQDFRPNMLDTPAAKQMLLESVLSERSLANEAAMENVEISEEVAIQLIKNFPMFQEKGQFSPQRYQNYLASAGYSDKYFVHKMRTDLARDLLSAGVARTAAQPPKLVERVYQLLSEKRTVSTAVIDAGKYLEGVAASDEEARAYWEGNRAEFDIPDEIDVQYVVLTPQLFRDATPTEEDVQGFYEQNKKRFMQPEERRASHILISKEAKDGKDPKKLAEEVLAKAKAAPADFAALAKEFSADPGSAGQGGDLDFFGKGMMVKPFEEAVFAAKKGDIVGPVETEFGWHVIAVTDVRPERVKPLEEVRGAIVELYRDQESMKAFAAEADNFTNMVYEQSESLQGVIDKYKLKPVSVDKLTAQGPKDEAARKMLNQHVMESLFSDECLREKRNAQAVEVAQNTLVAARVVNFRPQHVQPFEEAKEGIVSHIRQDKALAKARAEGEALAARLAKGEDAGVEFKDRRTVSRAQPGTAD